MTSSLVAPRDVTGSPKAHERLIVALDFPNDPDAPHRTIQLEDAVRIVDALGDTVEFYKVGWALYLTGHNYVIQELRKRGKRVFLDLKFGDIGETVRRLIAVAIGHGVELTTVNTTFQTVRAAVDAAKGSDLKVLTLTVLTSLDNADLEEQGFKKTVEEMVLYKTAKAKEIGCVGVVASGREARAIRELTGPDFTIVTPGIRPKNSSADDHKRATTPSTAILGGADYLVVGRPITLSNDPLGATQAILDEMQMAFDTRT